MFQKKIQWWATDNATSTFNRDRKSDNIKYDHQELLSYAQLEAEKFYSSGKLFLLPVSWFGRQDEIKRMYGETFVDMYSGCATHYKSRHP